MGESIEQAKEILDICHAKNLTAGVNFQLRQAPYMIAARKLIQDGVIGDIVDIDWSCGTSSMALVEFPVWPGAYGN